MNILNIIKDAFIAYNEGDKGAIFQEDVIHALAHLLNNDKPKYINIIDHAQEKGNLTREHLKDLKEDVKKASPEIKQKDDNKDLVESIEPWDYEVNGSDLANELRNTFHKYLVLPDYAAEAMTLWAFSSYAINAFRIFPKLCIRSPEKRCGKTTTLEVIEGFSHKVWSTVISQTTVVQTPVLLPN